MRISLRWMRELVDFELSPEALGEALTLVGFEVEEIEDRNTWADGVVVGRILEAVTHPNADRLRVCQVDLGQASPSTIVCGAPNARAGLTVAVAVPGTYLPTIDRKIAKAELRGVTSAGMICSLAELGLTKDSEGIHEFPIEHPLGTDVRPLLGLDDVVLDLTSTANRADALSMVGIAREVAALTRNPIKLPDVPNFETQPLPNFELAIADPKACPAYSGTLIRGVKIGPSPDWLRQRLEAAGTRSINNVVDITNLVLLEWGQPLHAFDWDRLQQVIQRSQGSAEGPQQIGVRFAQEGESLTTLDGSKRSLKPENLLITAADHPVALAGVMGGEETEVHAETQAVFLEAALFDPVVIRRSARGQSLRSEASTRYERGVNFSALDQARDRAIHLILDLAGGELVGQTVFDQRPQVDRRIDLRLSRLMDILGDDIKPSEVETILPALGFELSPCRLSLHVDSLLSETHHAEHHADPNDSADLKESSDQEAVTSPSSEASSTETATAAKCIWTVNVPPYRLRDIEREIDLIEEFARLYGYDQFVETLPPETQVGSLSIRERNLRTVREVFRGVGLTELMHISLCSAESGVDVVISNPLSPEFSALRQELLPGLIDSFQYNVAQGNGPLNGFEMGRIFWREGEHYQEADHLGGILGGHPAPNDWRHQVQPYDWFAAKGILVAALEQLGCDVEFKPAQDHASLHPGRTASLWMNGSRLGLFGQLHPQLRQAKDLPDEVYAFELDLELIVTTLEQRGIQHYHPYSTFPASDRDIAFFAPLEISVASLEQGIRAAAGPLLESVQLFDEYRGTGVPDQQRSLAFRLIYRALDRTLTDAEVDQAQQQVRSQLETEFHVTLRS